MVARFFARSPAESTRQQAEVRWWSAGRVEQIIDHEIGHALHHKAIGYDYNSAGLREPFDEETAAKIRAKVSGYAAQSRVEFVAEVYAGLKAGIEYGKAIIDFFLSLGGVLP